MSRVTLAYNSKGKLVHRFVNQCDAVKKGYTNSHIMAALSSRGKKTYRGLVWRYEDGKPKGSSGKRRPIEAVKEGKIVKRFSCVIDANAAGFSNSAIYRALKGIGRNGTKFTQYKGYEWRYEK